VPQPYSLTIKNNRTGETISLAGEFADADWLYLLDFLGEADRLRKTRMIAQGMEVDYEFSWNHETGQQHKATLPPEDDVAAFLHRLRPFVLQQEPFFLPKVMNLLRKTVDNKKFNSILNVQTDRFFGRFKGLTIATDTLDLTSDDTVLKWLNALEYHRDADKQKELREAASAIPAESQRAIFLAAMVSKAGTVLTLAEMIGAFRDRSGATIL
jgi:hypothetical protein